MIEGTLTAEAPESEEFTFQGSACFVMWGNGSAQILRSVNGSPFLPMTDGAGDAATFENEELDGVILNADIENGSRSAKYKIVAQTSLGVNFNVSWGW